MPQQAFPPDLVVRARRIHLLGGRVPAEALLVRAGRVAFAGTFDEAARRAPSTPARFPSW
jgi:hypothetical protein